VGLGERSSSAQGVGVGGGQGVTVGRREQAAGALLSAERSSSRHLEFVRKRESGQVAKAGAGGGRGGGGVTVGNYSGMRDEYSPRVEPSPNRESGQDAVEGVRGGGGADTPPGNYSGVTSGMRAASAPKLWRTVSPLPGVGGGGGVSSSAQCNPPPPPQELCGIDGTKKGKEGVLALDSMDEVRVRMQVCVSSRVGV
jgi:hypothetical protein